MNHGGPYVGYANGGLITKEQIARVGEGNKREWIIPEERAYVAATSFRERHRLLVWK